MSMCVFFFSSRRRHTRCSRDWSSDVCSSDLRERRCYCRALVSPPWVSRHVSCGVPVGNGVDEGLIVLLIRAVGDRERLPVGLGGKALRANVGNPDLDGTKARGAQCLAVLLHTLGHRGAQTLPGPGWTHAILLKKVTCNIMHSSGVTCNAPKPSARGWDRRYKARSGPRYQPRLDRLARGALTGSPLREDSRGSQPRSPRSTACGGARGSSMPALDRCSPMISLRAAAAMNRRPKRKAMPAPNVDHEPGGQR